MNNYSDMEKNTVDSSNQLKESQMVKFYNPKGFGKRIMFIGNSITLHGIKPDIGWHFEHGMAASEKEKDYVHILMSRVNGRSSDNAFCICQAAEWERMYKNGGETLKLYENARRFAADILIFRIMENCPSDNFDKAAFKAEALRLLKFLDIDGNAQIILTTPFWHHPGETAVEEMAEELKLPLVRLGDLGESDEMKAIGLFEHDGVANHPGDKGMEAIADRIFGILKKYI